MMQQRFLVVVLTVLCMIVNQISAFSQINSNAASSSSLNRRDCLVAGGLSLISVLSPRPAVADDNEPKITDKIYLTIKGLPASSEGLSTESDARIVIGLYGDMAPSSVAKIKALVTDGLVAPCKPKAERSLQKEQLEANKVFSSCKEQEDQGVLLRYSTVWRIIPNLRVDLGAVTGKFVAREYPDWNEAQSLPMIPQEPGIVSVRKGVESGFGMTICTGTSDKSGLDDMNENHLVVGKVIEGMNVVKALNNVPVITTAKQVNYMAVAGGNLGSNAPNRSCRYGGPMYCNENKPLVKLTVTEVGLL